MASGMSHWERVRAALKGEETDRVPISLWRHWPVEDETPQGLAAAIIRWQRDYDFDVVKLTPTGTYGIEDWGAETTYVPNDHGVRTVAQYGVTSVDQWPGLEQLDVTRGYLGNQIAAVLLVAEELQDSVPILQTVFSPLTTARKLAGDRIFADLRLHPETLKPGLQIIAETTTRFALESIRAGAHGVFFATQCDTYRLLSEAEYHEFGETYDRILLNAVRPEAQIILIHAHGQDIMFDLVKLTPTGTYGIEDWGAKTAYVPNDHGVRTVVQYGVTSVDQWPGLEPLDVTRGDLGNQITAVRLVAQELQDSVPILQTVFSPLTTARKLAGDRIFADLRLHPETFKLGLQIIAETTARFALESVRAGAYGVFFATQCNTYRLLSKAEYREFGETYDRIVLDAVRPEAQIILIHAHGQDIMFDLVADYPADAINWHDRITWLCFTGAFPRPFPRTRWKDWPERRSMSMAGSRAKRMQARSHRKSGWTSTCPRGQERSSSHASSRKKIAASSK